MVKKFSANVSNWFKKRLGSTASNIKMNGTQSAGTSENVAREDHVHPVDTSRAAASHTHGNITNAGAIGTAANKPIITTTSGKLSAGNFESTTTNIKMDGTQSVGSLNTFARGDHVHPTDTSRASTAAVTQSANGLMSKEDKIKLDKSMSISAGNVGGTTSAYTVSLTGVTLTHGTLIALYNAVGANAASATLNVNSLGAKPIYYNASAITAGRYPNKSTCIFMYNTSIVSTGCWQLIYSYDSNTTYTAATLKDATAHSEAINTAANATQTSINSALDSAIKEVDEKCDDIVAGDIDLSSTHSHTKSQITDFPTSMTPSSHAHGNVTNDGKVGTAANKPLITGTNGVVQAGSFGTAANTFCQGNDSRLSNARTPTDNSVTTAKLVDSSVTNAKLADPANNITEYIIGTHGTTATPNWTGTSTKITSLQAGQVIYFKMTSAGTSAGDTLNLTLANGSTTGAKNIYYNATTKLTTQFPVNSILCLVYDGTNWLCTEIQNTNTTYTAASATPLVDGTAAVGTSAKYAREDHVHPTDTSRAAASHSHTKSEITDFPTTMTPASHTHGTITNDGKVGTTANKPLITGTGGAVSAGSFEGTATNIKMNGTQSVGSLNTFARGDHVHPVDTSRAAANHTHNNLVTQSIPSSANLNDYTTVGIYKNTSNSNVKTMTNTPWGDTPTNGQAFVMVVLDHAGVTQILRPYNTTDYNIYTRNYYNGNWGAWKTIYTNGNIPSASTSQAGIIQIGTGASNASAGNHTHTKSEISDFPTTMTPSSHTHVLGDITNVTTLGANENLNSYHTVGLYYCDSTNSASLSNKPYKGNYMTLIENKRVMNDNSKYVIQTVYIITTYAAGSWYRLYVNGTWSPWKYISGTDNGISSTDYPNLDGLVQDGLYTITGANSLNIDLPYEDKSACFVRVIDYRIKDNPAQFVYPITAGLGDIYYRNATGANTDGTLNWQPWQKIFTSKNLAIADITNTGITGDDIKFNPTSNVTINDEVSTKFDTAGTGLEQDGTKVSIKSGGVTATQLASNAVTSAKIADKTIVAGDIADTTITGGKLANATVTATQLASNAVETAKIKDSAVTSAKIADGTIVNADIASNASIAFSKLNISQANIAGLGIAKDTHSHFTSYTDIQLTQNGCSGTFRYKIVDDWLFFQIINATPGSSTAGTHTTAATINASADVSIKYHAAPYYNSSGTGAISISGNAIRLTHYQGTKGALYTSGCFYYPL